MKKREVQFHACLTSALDGGAWSASHRSQREAVDCIHLAQDRNQWQAGSCEHGNEPLGSIKGREFLD